MIEIDGSRGEGGGQILRSALALSLLTGKPFRMVRIRANRKPQGGLRPQHLMSVRSAAKIGSAEMTGDSIGSSNLTFRPGPVVSGEYTFRIGTAGATALVLHTVYLPLAHRGSGSSQVVIDGGTHVAHAPNYDFLATTWNAYLSRMGLSCRLTMARPGFYPRGGGQIVAEIEPCPRIRPIRFTESPVRVPVRLVGVTAGLDSGIADRMVRRARIRLSDRGYECSVETAQWVNGPAALINVVVPGAVPTTFTALGEKGRPAEAVADEAVDSAVAFLESGAPVDSHSADQILLPLALADGPSEFRTSEVTQHLRTNVETIGYFLDRPIRIDESTVRIGATESANPATV